MGSLWRGLNGALKNAFSTVIVQPTFTILVQTGHELNVLSALGEFYCLVCWPFPFSWLPEMWSSGGCSPKCLCSWVTAVSDQRGSAGSTGGSLMCCLCLLKNVRKNASKVLGEKCHSIHRVNLPPGQCLVWTAEMEDIWREVFWPVWLRVCNRPPFLLLVSNSRHVPWCFQ